MPKQQRTSNLLCRDVALKLGIVKFIGKVSLHDSLFGFGQWDTEPVKLCLKENAIPFAIHASRNIPFKLMEPVKIALNDMVQKDIIEVITSHTDWASAVVPVLKLDKKDVRICVDFRKLNNNLKREVFHIPTFDELSCKLSDVKYLTKLDAASGFFQIPLEEHSRNLTTFLTPFGRNQFKRLPMGINIAPEIYQRKMYELLGDIGGVLIYMDDVIVFGKSESEHDDTLKTVLDRIKAAGLKLNKKKCEFKKQSLEFLGHNISYKGVSVSSDKIDAIKRLNPPKTVQELRRILGMFNFVTKFVKNAQSNLSPLNELLKKDSSWCWETSQQSAFENMKKELCAAPALSYFDPNKPMIVSADSSSYAIGGVLLQKHGKVLRTVAYCSRSLNNAEKNYAQIGKELLASVYAYEKFRMYVLGAEFTLQSDHKPFIPLINIKSLCDAPARC